MCGEKQDTAGPPESVVGSPPRVRGEGCPVATGERCPGITPACAGRSNIGKLKVRRPLDHPRVCGEKTRNSVIKSYMKGSPPRVRGEDGVIEATSYSTRITPACAGRSVVGINQNQLVQDHPRVCGEKASTRQVKVQVAGSPPRVRGEVDADRPAVLHDGITPACAGRRKIPRGTRRPKPDHPRVCGEKSDGAFLATVTQGSPPRVRGEAGGSRFKPRGIGITPACAGRRIL